MQNLLQRTLLAWACVLLAGCATLDRSECLNADWRLIGYEDGLAGRQMSHIGRHRTACAKHGVVPNANAYGRGRDEGLLSFCEPRNGYRVGVRGARYPGVCPQRLDGAFRTAYEDGRQVYEAGREVRRLANKVRHQQEMVDTLVLELKQVEAELVARGVTVKRRRVLLASIRELEDQISREKVLLGELETALQLEGERLAELRRRRPYL